MKLKKKINNFSSSKLDTLTNDQLLTEILERLPVAIIIISLTKILFANKNTLKIIKSEKTVKKKLIKHSIFDFLLPEYHQNFKEYYLKIINGEKVKSFEVKIKNNKNQIIDIEVKSNPVIFNGEKVIQVIFNDISKYSLHLKNLEIAKENFDLISKNSKDLISFFTYHPQRKYFFINEAVKNILGYNPKDFYNNGNLGYDLVIDKIDYKSFNNTLRKKEKNNTLKFVRKTFQYKTKTGKLIWIENDYSPIYNDIGKIKFILCVSRDITKEKIAQLELEQKWNNYKNLLDISPIGIVIHDGICIYCNKTAANILEVSDPKKLIGKNLIKYFVPTQREQAIGRTKKAIKGEELVNLQYKIKTHKKNIIDVELKSVPFIYKGKPCVQTTISNITQIKKLEKEKIRAEIAEESNKELKLEISVRQKIQDELIIQTTKYSAIFNNTSHLIWTVDRNLAITSFNLNYFDYVKNVFDFEIAIGTKLMDIKSKVISKPNISFWVEKYNWLFKNKLGKKIEFFEAQNEDINGKTHYREIYLHAITDHNGMVNEVAAIAQDVTDRKHSEQKIINQSAKLNAIFESGNHLIWTINNHFELTSYNKNYFNLIKSDLLKKDLEENKVISVLDTIENKIKKEFWKNKYKIVLEGKSHVFVHKSIINNIEVYREVHLYPIYLDEKVVEVSIFAQDISERIESEKIIEEQSSRQKAVFESGEQLMWTVNKNFVLTSFNKNFSDDYFQNFGSLPKAGIVLINKPKVLKSGLELNWETAYYKAFQGEKIEYTPKTIKEDGSIIYKQYYLYPIRNVDQEVVEVSVIGFDITEKRTNEDKINESLKEKEILLKEVHHRVKNNMQVISSILNLQSSYVKDIYSLNLLKECQNRIKSMAFIHESLYQSKNFESVNFSDYISTLTKNLVHTYSVNSKKIKLILTLDKLFLNLDISIPCGLIINEIISNSLKYAFPNNADGMIFVTLVRNNKKILLEIGDNGIGIPYNIDIKQSQTLGLQLVDTLVEQINGTINLERIKGTKFKIEFNI